MKKFMVFGIILISLLTAIPGICAEYTYYLPYFIGGTEYWTGVALRNSSSSQYANTSAAIYNPNGSLKATENKIISPRGQNAFIAGDGLSGEGWIKVKSDQPLTGLSFFGTNGYGNYMADITLIPQLATLLYVPHVAQNSEWDTTIMVCNPNTAAVNVTLTFADQDGNISSPRTYTISPNGSGKYDVSDLTEDAVTGSVEISATQGIAAFALYDNLKWGGWCYSGISAVAPEIVNNTDAAVYPMTTDINGNGINDYVEEATHLSGSGKTARSAYPGHGGDHHGYNDLPAGPGLYNHAFTDVNNDGICDYAQNGSSTWHGPGFIDEDNDGICDYWDTGASMYNRHQGVWFYDENQNMINDMYEAEWHVGSIHNFVDDDGDGICDYAQNGSSTWHGPGFTDEDNDGVCDYWQPGGRGYGGHHQP